MWKVLIFASLVGSSAFTVEVLDSGTGERAGSGTIFSATFEIGSREAVSVTEARPREKTAGRTAAGKSQSSSQLGFVADKEAAYLSAS